ncbi:MAG: phosphatase PAP2 family protein [Phycisphaerales bacterium]
MSLLQQAQSPFGHVWRQLRQEPLTLAIIVLLAGAGWGFAELADEVTDGDTHELDRSILLALRNADDPTDPIGPRWLEEMMRDFTALGGISVMVILTVTAVVYLAIDRRLAMAFAVLLAVAGGFLLSLALKSGFDRPRPDLVPHGSIVYTRSFPSGHSMTATIVYLVLGAMVARVQARRAMKWFLMILAVVLSVVVGVSRVYLGVHWPTDVLAGWAAGAGWALAWWLVITKVRDYLKSKHTPESEAIASELEADEEEVAKEEALAAQKRKSAT